MIVDTSAVMAILKAEPSWEQLKASLLGARDARISAGTLIELRVVAEQRHVSRELNELCNEVAFEVVPVDARQVELAHEGFVRFGKGRHPSALNYGDLFAYALARAYDEPLLYVGTDFGLTDIRSTLAGS